jgi:type VI secretion system protein ImpL
MSAGATLKNATAAKVAARQMTAGSVPDPVGHVDSTVEKLVLDPITNVEALLRGLGPAELNGKAKVVCGQLKALMNKFPFNPNSNADATLAEVNGVFANPSGALWTFYDSSLKNLLVKQGTPYAQKQPIGTVTLTPAFIAFFNRATAFSDAIYAGGSQDPHLTYSLKFVPTEGIQSVGLDIDGQLYNSAAPKPLVWQGSGTHGVKATVKLGGTTDLNWYRSDGIWAIFHFFSSATHREPAGDNELLDWTLKTGNQVMTLPSGKPLTLRLELDMAGAPPVFQRGFASQFACSGDIAN